MRLDVSAKILSYKCLVLHSYVAETSVYSTLRTLTSCSHDHCSHDDIHCAKPTSATQRSL